MKTNCVHLFIHSELKQTRNLHNMAIVIANLIMRSFCVFEILQVPFAFEFETERQFGDKITIRPFRFIQPQMQMESKAHRMHFIFASYARKAIEIKNISMKCF